MTSTPPSRNSTLATLPAKRPPYAHTWSVIAGAYAAFNRHELPAMTPDWVNIDHRPRHDAFAPGDLAANHPCGVGSRARPQHPHRGRASAQRPRSSRHPRRAWRPRKRASTPSGGSIELLTVDGDLLSRCELFDEADIDAALARFDELSSAGAAAGKRGKPSIRAHVDAFRGPRLGSHGRNDRPRTYSSDDRRRVVNAGVRHGRDALIANMRATAEVGVESMTSTRRCDARGAPRPQSCPLLAPRRGRRTKCSPSPRSTPTTG